MVLASHRTPVGSGLMAVTVETVILDPPSRMGFRLLRGPVPHVTETFTFDETADGTRLTYSGELGTDLRRLGRAWGDLVARSWVDVVRDSMAHDQDRERTLRTEIVTPLAHPSRPDPAWLAFCRPTVFNGSVN
jgi:hypothetical protein